MKTLELQRGLRGNLVSGLTVLLFLASLCAARVVMADTNMAVQLQISLAGAPGSRTPELSWASQTGAVYKIQGRTSLSPGVPWETIEPVTAESNLTRWKAPELNSNSDTRFLRLELPEPEIFTIEPARFAFGGPVELYVIGQCFGTNTELRIGPMALTNREVIHPGLMRVTFTPQTPGTYVFDLVRTGAVLSSFLVECYEAGAPPPSVLQEPPDEPWAAPHFKEVTGLDVFIDCVEVQEGGLNHGSAFKVKEKGNRTKCKAPLGDHNWRITPSGEVEADEVDLLIPGVGLDFIWGRRYRSRSGPNTEQGNRWDFSYNVRVTQVAGGMEVRDGMGRADVFPQDADGTFGRDEHFSIGTLTGGVFRLTFADTGYWEFLSLDGSATAGRLARIVDRNSNTMRLEYDAPGRLVRVIDTLDHTNTIAYSAVNGKISSVTDFTGRSVTYAYYRGGEAGGNDGDLKSVTSPAVTGTPNGNDFPAGKTTTFTYSRGFADPRENSLLLAITDAKGQITHRHVYQHNQTDLEFLRCVGRQVGTTNDRLTYAYLPQSPSPANRYATMKIIVNDRVGNVSEHLYDARLRRLQARELTGRALPGLRVSDTTNRPAGRLRADDPDYFETRLEWNNDSLCTHVTHPRGNSTEMVYQRAYNQNSARSNHPKRHDGNLRVLRERACCGGADTDGDGLADTDELVTRFGYDPRFGSPIFPGRRSSGRMSHYDFDFEIWDEYRDLSVHITDPNGNVSTASYDARGNCVRIVGPILAGNDAPEIGCAYNAFGQLTSVSNAADGLGRRRVDAAEYYDSGPQLGYLRTATVDAQGPTPFITTYEYDARGNVVRCIDPRTNDWLYTYNALDQCVQRQTPNSSFGTLVRHTEQFSYDANDNLVRVDTENRDHTGALGANPFWRTEFQYDLLNRMTACWVDKDGNLVYLCDEYQYDANGNLVLHRSPEAVAGRDPNAVTRYEFDERDLAFREVRAPGTGLSATNVLDYDGNGNCRKVSKVDAITIKQTTFEHDGFDRRVRATDAMGNVETSAYDRNGNLVHQRLDGETTDVVGSQGNRRLNETRYEYDSLNRLTRFRPAFFDIFTELAIGDGEATTSFAYAPNGQLLIETDDNGRTTRYAYDSAWRLASVTDAKTNVVQYAYDACDNPISVTSIERSDLGGAEQRFSVSSSYDARNRLISRADNVGNTDQYFYDSRDNVVRHINPRGTLTGFTYDGLSRQTLAIADLNGDGLLDFAADIGSASTYDDNSRLVSTTDDNGNVTRHAYDTVDRLVATTNADNTVTRLVWSPRSNLILSSDPNGTMVSNSFDLLDRCVYRNIAPGPGVAATTTLEVFFYDAESRLVRAMTQPGGIDHTFVWSSLSDLREQSSGGHTLRATHDGVGNRLSATYPSGRVVQHTYDALDQPATFSTSLAGGMVQLTAHSYDGDGRLARVARANGINTRVNWSGLANPANPAGDFGWRQVARVNHARAMGGGSIDTRIAAHDRSQNKILRAQTASFSTGGPTTTNAFSYDNAHRLTRGRKSRTFEAQRDTDYVLDGNGNRQFVTNSGIAMPYAMNTALPEPADFQMDQYSLSPFGAHSYDRNGNLTSTDAGAGPVIYTYDYADRIVFVQRTVGPAMFDVAAYEYDALGRRISRTVFPPVPAAPVATHWFHDADCDGDGIIEEREDGALRRTYAFPHVFDQKGRVMFTDTGETYYFHDDELGNVLALTDAAGGIVERYDYDDYGLPHFLDAKGDPILENGQLVTESPAGNPFLFHGMQWEAETGLYLDQRDGTPVIEWTFEKRWPACYVDPRTGRQTTRMTTGGGMPNRISMNVTARAFAGNNPWSGGGGGGGSMRAGISTSRSNIRTRSSFASGGGGGGGGAMRAGISTSRSNIRTRGSFADGGGAMEVMFNPREYTITKATAWRGGSLGAPKKSFAQKLGGFAKGVAQVGLGVAGARTTDVTGEIELDAGREMTTGADWDYRLYGPGAAHWGSARFAFDNSEAEFFSHLSARGHRDVGGYRASGVLLSRSGGGPYSRAAGTRNMIIAVGARSRSITGAITIDKIRKVTITTTSKINP